MKLAPITLETRNALIELAELAYVEFHERSATQNRSRARDQVADWLRETALIQHGRHRFDYDVSSIAYCHYISLVG